MSYRIDTDQLRRAGNKALGLPNTQPRPGEPGYRHIADAEITAPAVVLWCEYYAAHLATVAVVGIAAAAVHVAVLALAVLPLVFLGVSEAERLTNNARVRSQREHPDTSAAQAEQTAGRAVTA